MTNQNNSSAPAIRFQGFDKDWSERQIAQVISETKRPIVLGDNQRYELVTVKRRNEGVVSRGHLYGREILVKNYSQLAEGDFLISKRQVVHGATGIVPRELDGAIVSNEYLVAASNDDLSTDFITLLSKRPTMYRKFFLSSYGVVIEKLFFDVEDWKKRTVTIPSTEEQSSICSWFKSLDRMLQLHRTRHEKLLSLKQAMLQKMFPQDGSTTPEVRFKGFNKPWESKNLGQHARFAKGHGYSKADLEKSGTPIVLYGRLYTNYQTEISNVNTFTDEKPGAIISKGNEVLVPASGESAEDMARASAITCSGVILGGDLNIITTSEDFEPYFLALSISNGASKRELAKKAQGKSIVHLRNSDIEPLNIIVPEIREQQKISDYFRTLDEMIVKYVFQIKKLRNIKSACLEKMFV